MKLHVKAGPYNSIWLVFSDFKTLLRFFFLSQITSLFAEYKQMSAQFSVLATTTAPMWDNKENAYDQRTSMMKLFLEMAEKLEIFLKLFWRHFRWKEDYHHWTFY